MRPLVGPLGLGAHQDDLAAESRIPKAGGDRVSCGAAADDQGSGRVFSS
jgi:hypothetical protein